MLLKLLITAAILAPMVLSTASQADEPLMLPRSGVSDETALALAGRSVCAIIYPTDDPAYRKIALEVQSAIREKTGVSVQCVPAGKAITGRFTLRKEYLGRNLILLGNINNNPALVRLSANYHLYSTCKWPGPNGYELRTATNPYGAKVNCIVAGGSDPAGVSTAANELMAAFTVTDSGRSLTVPRLLKVVVNGQDQAGLGVSGPVPAGESMTELYQFAATCEAYSTSGSPTRLEAVKSMLQTYLKQKLTPAAADYGTESAVRALDTVDSFCMSDAENVEMDNRLLQWELRIARDKPYWNQLGRQWSFGGHQACGSLSFYVIANYLLRNGNPNEPARAFLEKSLAQSREYLHYLSSSFKDNEKDVGWETWTPLSVIPRYALAEDDMLFFDEGVAEDVVARAFYADHGFGPAAFSAFVKNDGRYKSLAPNGESLAGWAFVLGGANYVTPDSLKPSSPDMLIGAKTLRASRTDWEHAYIGPKARKENWYTRVPYGRAVHAAGVDP